MKNTWAGILAICWATQAVADEAVDRTLPADPNGTLYVSNVNGLVEIEGWDKAEVQITGMLAENAELEIDADDRRIELRVEHDSDSRKWGWNNEWNRPTRLYIKAPKGSSIDISTVSADIEVRDMESEQRLSSVSGDIEAESRGEELRLKSVSGDVRIDGINQPARLRASAVSGDLNLRHISGEIEAETVSGRLRFEGEAVQRGEFKSVSGDVTIFTRLDDRALLEATTTSGSVDIVFSGGAPGDYELSSFSGDIDTCFGPKPERPRHRWSGWDHRFTEGDAAARIYVKTMSGDIDVCRD